ncbi:hypothetical protein H5V45_21230 [Nocardioides sp. KIGAM211]|uniref:AMIN-like domain-containing protein n=1 Tax=Nocardioides luti TaxID=2761101 RepID=A0A7X0RMF4_9ACTN|nr:hypothetical protein [Nocardioides luti]MBB6629855.1 hypothetical protein [Nocardioides luti]
MHRPRTARLASLLATAVTGALACTLLAAAAPADALPAWEDHATHWSTDAKRQARVVDLRYATHDTFDRVVVDLRRAIPRGNVRYQRHFAYEGSGERVPILGRSGLLFSFLDAAGHTYQGRDVYDGPWIARPHLDTLKALAITSDFEGVVGLAVALNHRADYRVFRLSNPRRLVIDVRHE